MKSGNYVFLSYHERDVEFILRLGKDLKNLSIPVCADCFDATPNDTQENRCRRIKNASLVIVVVSTEYLLSTSCHSDIRSALKTQTPVMYVSLEIQNINGAVSPLPSFLRDAEYVAAFASRTDRDYSRQFSGLLSALGKLKLDIFRISPAQKHLQYVHDLLSKTLSDILNDPLNVVRSHAFQRSYGDVVGINLLGANSWLEEARFAVLDPRDSDHLAKSEVFATFRQIRVSDLTSYPGLILFGQPGSGKTAILQFLLLNSIHQYLASPDVEPFPVYLNLMDWEKETSFYDFVHMNWPFADDPFLTFSHGNAVIFLDNLETIIENEDWRKSTLTDWLTNGTAPSCIVMACGAHDYRPDSLLRYNLPIALRIDVLSEGSMGASKGTQSGDFVPGAVGEVINKLWSVRFPTANALECDTGLAQLAAVMTDAGQNYVSHEVAQKYVSRNVIQAAKSVHLIEVHKAYIRFSHIQFQIHFAALSLDSQNLSAKISLPVANVDSERIPKRWDDPIKHFIALTDKADEILNAVMGNDPFLALECLANGAPVKSVTYDAVVNLAVEAMRIGGDFRLTLAKLLTKLDPISAKRILIDLLHNSDFHNRQNLALDVFRKMDSSGYQNSLTVIRELLIEGTSEQIPLMTGKVSLNLTPFLIDLLRASNSNIRCVTAQLAGRTRQKSMTPMLLNSLTDTDNRVADAATLASLYIKSPVFIPQFIQLIFTPSLRHRKHSQRSSIEVLSHFGKAGVEALLSLLDPRLDFDVRLTAARSLQAVRLPTTEDVLFQMTQDQDPSMRMFAIETLNSNDGQSMSRLVEALQDTGRSSHNQVRICDRVAHILKSSGDALAISKLRKWQEKNRRYGVRARKQHVNPAEPMPHISAELVKARLIASKSLQASSLAGDPTTASEVALESNAQADAEKSTLIRVLSADHSERKVDFVRQAITRKGDPEIIAVLLNCLRDTDRAVVSASIDALKQILPALTDEILELMRGPEVNLRAASIDIAGHFCDETAVSALFGCLDDTRSSWLSDKRICDAAAEVLKQIGTSHSLAALDEWYSSKNQTTHPEASSDQESSFTNLLGDLYHNEWDRRQTALKGLQHIARASRGTRDAPLLASQLLKLLNDSDWVIRWSGTEALGWVGNSSAIPLLSRLVTDPNWNVRISAIRAMAEIGDQQAIHPISMALSDPNHNVREVAAEALGAFKTVAIISSLTKAVSDSEPFVRLAAVESLSKIQNEAVTQLLTKALDDENSDVRWAAAQGLSHLQDYAPSIAVVESPEDTDGPYWEHRRITDLVSGSRKNADSSVPVEM